MQFLSLASSSKGNCYYIGDATEGILIDCGISTKRIVGALATVPGALDNIKAVFITHEHTDHIKGLPVFLKRYRIPCFGTRGTIQALYGMKNFDSPIANSLTMLSGNHVMIGDMTISWSQISHDASDPVGYTVQAHGRKIGILTDTGELSVENKLMLYDSDLLFVESNHDRDMLRVGPYPAFLKKRIAGVKGHLSNADCAESICEMVTPRTRHVILGHLSEENNRPELAFQTIQHKLQEAPLPAHSRKLWVAATSQHLHLELSVDH